MNKLESGNRAGSLQRIKEFNSLYRHIQEFVYAYTSQSSPTGCHPIVVEQGFQQGYHILNTYSEDFIGLGITLYILVGGGHTTQSELR